jgi:hypothetical protein
MEITMNCPQSKPITFDATWGERETVFFLLTKYEHGGGGGVAIEGVTPSGEPFCSVAVNIQGSIDEDKKDTEFLLDENNMQKPLVEKMVAEGLIAPVPGRSVKSGFCTYPVYTVDRSKFTKA